MCPEVAIFDGLYKFGFMTTPQIKAWARLAITDEAMRKRLERMAQQDRIVKRNVKSQHVSRLPCWTLSTKTLDAMGCLPYVAKIARTTARHHLVATQVAINLAHSGYEVDSERELYSADKDARDRNGWRERPTERGAHMIQVMPNGRPVRYGDKRAVLDWHNSWMPEHRPDLAAGTTWTDSPRVAIEVELSIKADILLRTKMRWYMRQQAFSRVIYLCANRTIERAAVQAANAVISQAAEDAATFNTAHGAVPNMRKLNLHTAVLSDAFLAAATSNRSLPADSLEGLAWLAGPPSRTADSGSANQVRV